MSSFALVPGAWHGSWCFEGLARELEVLGHTAVAVELPSERPEASLADHVEAVVLALSGADDTPVVVGHSLSGITIPLVAAARPVGLLVFLAAFVPRPGVSADQEFQTGGFRLAPGAGEGREIDVQGRSYWADPEKAIELLYHDCDPAEAAAAAARLRPQGQRSQQEPCPLVAWPEVRSSYVRCTDDRMYDAELGSEMAGDRLGVVPIEIASGHSPFLSRPRELAALLDGLT